MRASIRLVVDSRTEIESCQLSDAASQLFGMYKSVRAERYSRSAARFPRVVSYISCQLTLSPHFPPRFSTPTHCLQLLILLFVLRIPPLFPHLFLSLLSGLLLHLFTIHNLHHSRHAFLLRLPSIHTVLVCNRGSNYHAYDSKVAGLPHTT